MPSVQCALPRLGRDLSREPLQAIVNVSNKAQLKQQIIRAQAKKDLDVYLEQQERIKARQAAEAFQVLCVCAKSVPAPLGAECCQQHNLPAHRRREYPGTEYSAGQGRAGRQSALWATDNLNMHRMMWIKEA